MQEESFTVLEMSDSVGWAIKAEIQSCDSEANGIPTPNYYIYTYIQSTTLKNKMLSSHAKHLKNLMKNL